MISYDTGDAQAKIDFDYEKYLAKDSGSSVW